MNNSNELYHHGIMGMKWGVRRYQNPDGSYTSAGRNRYNKNYSSEQRSRDKRVYGRGGVRRINKSMNKGESVSAARSKEADRIYAHRRAGVYSGQIGGIVGGVGGAVGGLALSKIVLKKYGTGDMTVDAAIRAAVTAGAAKVAQLIGRHGGQSLAMLAGGYDPRKFRYS